MAIVLAVAGTAGIYTTYVMQTLRSEAEQHLHERAERLAAVLSQALARPLFDINGGAVASVVDASGATPEVLLLRVLAPDGSELASYVAPQSAPAAALRVRRDVLFSDARRAYPVGTIELAFSRQQIDADLRRQIINTVAANLLLALAIVASIMLVGRKAMRPFADIEYALGRLSEGHTDIVLSGIGRDDQIGRLSAAVRSFRDSLRRLHQAETALRELNGALEQKIAERTGEVTSSMQLARASEHKLQTIVDTALDAVVQMDLRGRIVGWNRQAEKIFGWRRDEVLGQALDTTIIPPRFRYAHRRGMQRYLAHGSGSVLDSRIEVEALHRDGSEFPIELAITQLHEQDGVEFCAFLRDISERRERERKLVRANVAAEAANIAKSEFLANMSHEIRTPMSAVIGMAYLTLRTELSPKQQDYVGKIHRAALSLLGIINDILDFSKIEAGRLELEQVPFSLDEVLANVASVTAQSAADKQLEYLFHVPPAVPRQLQGDPLRLGQVLINLVNNAIKFTEAGELELRCSLCPEPAPGRVRLHFAVRDTGIGMDEQQQGKLFQAFSQGNGSTSRQFGGTGLGLSISQQLVSMMGGQIDVDSVPGLGSTFSFELDFGPGAPARPIALPEALRQARLLVVDDNRSAQQLLVDTLQAMPLRADGVDGALAALQALAEADLAGDPYRLVLCDWQMPGMDGIELARQLGSSNALKAPPPLVLLTAFGREQVQQQAEEAGVAGFLFKPVEPAALFEVLCASLLPAQAAPVPVPVPPALLAPVRQQAARVLLVEDNPINQEIAAELMALQGISVDIAANGIEALDCLRLAGPHAYGLVLMDLEMPLMDGHATIVALRQDSRFADLPVAAMTAHALTEVRERCLAEGMQDYLTKPIEPEQLFELLSRWLGPAQLAAPATPAQAQPALPELPGIDRDAGLRNAAGNGARYLHLLGRFRLAQLDTVDGLRGELERGELALATARARTLHDAAAHLGVNAVAQAARQVEVALLARGSADPTQAELFNARPDLALDDGVAALAQTLPPVLAMLERQLPAEAPTVLEAGGAAQVP